MSKLWWLYFGRGEPLQPTGTECAPKRRLGITEGAVKVRLDPRCLASVDCWRPIPKLRYDSASLTFFRQRIVELMS